MSGKLFIIGTPIGNLQDMSKRCVQTLTDVDFIAAEDTRNSLKLLNHIGIKKEMISYFEHNKAQKGPIIINRILNGETCGIITDAGMPAISDPGEDLVRLCHENNIEVNVIPGPCAAVSALALSGLVTGRFTFEGFLPSVASKRKSSLSLLATEERTMIFYEAPHRLKKTLRDMLEAFGDREIAICKEITKLHEKTLRTTLKEACEIITEDEKGEFVLVISGYEKEAKEYTDEDIKALLKECIEEGLSVSYAVKTVVGQTGLSKNKVYGIANTVK